MSSLGAVSLLVVLVACLNVDTIFASHSKRSVLGALRNARCSGVRCRDGYRCTLKLGATLCCSKTDSSQCESSTGGRADSDVGKDKAGGCSFVQNSCPVTIKRENLCRYNPCLAKEYCTIVDSGQIRCCTQRVIRTSIPSTGFSRNRCTHRCLLPPQNPPFPLSPSCPGDGSNPRVQDPDTTVRPNTTITTTTKTTKPTTADSVNNTDAPVAKKINAPVVTDAPVVGTNNQSVTVNQSCGCSAPAPKNGRVKFSCNVVAYRCEGGFRLKGKNSLKCVNGQLEGKPPRCKKAKVGNGRCFTSFDNCTACFRGKNVCKPKKQVTCPSGSYCKAVGSKKIPKCCSMSEDSFGRCSESCIN
ncbi:uncharacterized protein LOC134197847 [Corticium candelabrum]|uniref:uncharacterized protein LOC134197847 n=1 Tax=Corticium candelabrum TaxID=121492 RepID=UPI002E25374F|nr:uncharacterized protein LOC134197847 [Corticium candelabrum]